MSCTVGGYENSTFVVFEKNMLKDPKPLLCDLFFSKCILKFIFNLLYSGRMFVNLHNSATFCKRAHNNVCIVVMSNLLKAMSHGMMGTASNSVTIYSAKFVVVPIVPHVGSGK